MSSLASSLMGALSSSWRCCRQQRHGRSALGAQSAAFVPMAVLYDEACAYKPAHKPTLPITRSQAVSTAAPVATLAPAPTAASPSLAHAAGLAFAAPATSPAARAVPVGAASCPSFPHQGTKNQTAAKLSTQQPPRVLVGRLADVCAQLDRLVAQQEARR